MKRQLAIIIAALLLCVPLSACAAKQTVQTAGTLSIGPQSVSAASAAGGSASSRAVSSAASSAMSRAAEAVSTAVLRKHSSDMQTRDQVSTPQSAPQSTAYTSSNSHSVRTERVQKRVIVAKYQNTEKASGIQKHDRDVYLADDGSKLEYDHTTGELVFLCTYEMNPGKTANSISQDQAVAIAQDYLKTKCDLSQYTFNKAEYSENMGYDVYYSRMICGYPSADFINVTVTSNGDIAAFLSNPHVFDGVALPGQIDEAPLLGRLDGTVKSDFGSGLVCYTITDKRLILNESNQLAMSYDVLVTREVNGKPWTDGIVFEETVQ